MNKHLAEFAHAFDAVLQQTLPLLFIARDSEMQREMLPWLAAADVIAAQLKAKVVAAGREEDANLLLGYQRATRWLSAELNMWLELKAEKPERAWGYLVAAQSAILDAIRAHASFTPLVPHRDRLEQIESLVFPPQLYFSVGLIVTGDVCTVCKAPYRDCDHIVGRPYMGEICTRLLTEVQADHLSIVMQPANKLARLTHVSAAGGMRNRMTWKIERGSSTGSV